MFQLKLGSKIALAFVALAYCGSSYAEVSASDGRTMAGDTYYSVCSNEKWCCDCELNGISSGYSPYITGIICAFYNSIAGSRIDNLAMAHTNDVWDYRAMPATGGCSSCGGGSASDGSGLWHADLRRIHRYRQVAMPSNLGVGVFTNYDIQLALYTLNGANFIDLYDPNTNRFDELFVDGQYNDVDFGNTNDALDGVYTCFKTNAHKSLQLFDGNGVLCTNQANAASAVLETWDGRHYYFQIINVNGSLAGRLTRAEDRNGYATTITYQFQPGVADSSSLWQMDTVTDPHGKQLAFTYNPVQQGGRWVISSVNLPNGTTVSYSYSGGYLSGVQHADGTQSTITRSFEPVSQCTVVHYFDASAEESHRAKDVYLTTNYVISPDDPDEIFPQGAQLIRMVINGNNEVTYLNIPHPVYTLAWVLDGNVLKQIYCGWQVQYATSFDLGNPNTPGWGYGSVQATLEPSFDFLSYNYGAGWQTWFRQTPDFSIDAQGLQISYTYNQARQILSKTYPDGSTEAWTYNNFQQVTQYTDRDNRVTQFTYDARGNRLSKTAGLLLVGGNVTNTAETATWNWSYFPAGNANQFLLQTATDANGNVTSYAYDANHYQTSVTEPPDNVNDPLAVRTFSYDSAGRISSATDAVGRTTVYGYDARSRVTSILYPDSSTDLFTFGAGVNSNLLTDKTDRSGYVTHFDYDLSGRTVTTTIAYNTPVAVQKTCSYIPGTTLRSTCVDKGNQTAYTYDYRDRVVATAAQANTATTLTTTTTYTNNLVTSMGDAYNRQHYLDYDVNKRVIRSVQETVPGGVPAGSTISALSRVLTNNAPYLVEDMGLDSEGQVLTKTDGRGTVAAYTYDSRGRLTQSVEAFGSTIAATTQFQYDAQGNRTLVIKPRQFAEGSAFQTAYAYTGRNLLKSKTEAFGKPEAATESYTYYLDRRPQDTTDGRGNVWTKVWKQCCARLGVVADPSIPDYTGGPNPIRPVSLYEYNYFGDATHVSRARNVDPLPTCCLDDVPDADTINETTTKYDARHRPIAQTVWLTPLPDVDEQNPYIYGDAGAPAGAVGLTTRWVYDDDMTDGTGLDATYAAYLTDLNLGAGSVGGAVETTDPAGDKTVTIYDGVGRVVKTIDGNGNPTKKTYDAMVAGISGAPGNLLESAMTDALNHTTKAESDGASRTLATIDALSNASTFGYDAANNRVSWRDPNGVGQDCAFDVRNRDVQCTDTHGDSTGKAYDADNNVVTMTDALGHSTTCAYDARERKVSCTDRNAGVTGYQYDANSNLTQITDAQGGPTLYTYDARNLLATETFPDSGVRAYAYDGANRLISRLDQANATTAYLYDMANRLTSRNYPDSANDTFAYDAASRLTSAASARYGNTVTRTYDQGSRLTGETDTINSVNYVVGYGYDAANRQTAVTYPDGGTVGRIFTNRNQLDTVNYNGSLAANFVYDNGMRKTMANFGNGLSETRTYRLDNLNNTIKIPGVTDFTYSWDANKRKLGEADGIVPPVNSQTFGYDNEDRLTSFNRQNGDSQTWNLSLVGDWNQFNANGTAQTRTHNSVHELTAINGTALNYDVKGNLTQNSNVQSYIWDYENRMQSATSGGTTLGTYAYDALGRRVSKMAGATTTVFVNDGLQEICEYDNGAAVGSPSRSYVFGSYIDEPLLMVNGGIKTFYHTNNLYSIAALTNAAGAVVERYTYDPYGKVKILAPNGVSLRIASSVGNPWMYQGRRLDLETGLMQFRTRYYSTELGRFLNRMPWMAIGGKVNFTTYLPFITVRYNKHWHRKSARHFRTAQGAYIQRRYNLYDFEMFCPTRFVEPFSVGTSLATEVEGDGDDEIGEMGAENSGNTDSDADFHSTGWNQMRAREEEYEANNPSLFRKPPAEEDTCPAKPNEPPQQPPPPLKGAGPLQPGQTREGQPAAGDGSDADDDDGSDIPVNVAPPGSRNLPLNGPPRSASALVDDDGNVIQIRVYGEDGLPIKDIDFTHDHGAGMIHGHDWGRNPDGSADGQRGPGTSLPTK